MLDPMEMLDLMFEEGPDADRKFLELMNAETKQPSQEELMARLKGFSPEVLGDVWGFIDEARHDDDHWKPKGIELEDLTEKDVFEWVQWFECELAEYIGHRHGIENVWDLIGIRLVNDRIEIYYE